MIVLAASTTASSSVATLSSAVAEPTEKVAVAGAVPLTVAPVSLTFTSTVSAAAVSPVLVRVKMAASPSVTGLAFGAMDISASPDAGPGTVVDTASASARSSSVHTAPVSVQARAGSVMAMSPSVSGSIMISQPVLELFSRRRALVTVPPLTSNAAALSVR